MKRKIPQLPDYSGYHNQNLDESINRLSKGQTYADLSTVWICVSRGTLRTEIFTSWMNLTKPMNQKVAGPYFFTNDEVGVAYQKAFETIVDHPEFSKWKYILTTEEDNLPPVDGLLKLYESIQKYDAVGGLYWTKGEGGQPMIYGDPNVMPMNFIPQMPKPDTIQRCNGLGMGFNLYRISMFKKLQRPWFKTIQEQGKGFTQDLWFYNNAGAAGFKFACDTRVKVGHMDVNTGKIW